MPRPEPRCGSPNKTPFPAVLSKNLEGHPIVLRLSVAKGFRKRELAAWAAMVLDPDCIVDSDGLACSRAIADIGIEHQPVVTGGGAASVELADFTWVHTIVGNVKYALHGTYHPASAKHLPRYLAEFCYRFDLAAMLPRVGRAAACAPPMPYRLLKLAEVHW